MQPAKNSREICPIFYERKETIYDHSLLKHRPSRSHERHSRRIPGHSEAIGLEAFTQLTLLCGGQSLYIPKRESLERNARDRDIRARFNGCNYRALAVQFRLSERQIRKIINGTRT